MFPKMGFMESISMVSPLNSGEKYMVSWRIYRKTMLSIDEVRPQQPPSQWLVLHHSFQKTWQERSQGGTGCQFQGADLGFGSEKLLLIEDCGCTYDLGIIYGWFHGGFNHQTYGGMLLYNVWMVLP